MNWEELDDDTLVATVDAVRGEEERIVAKMIGGLAEIWKRKLPQAVGYSSLFTYCLERLRYPRTSAARRAAAAKVAIDLPKVIDYLRDGASTADHCARKLNRASRFLVGAGNLASVTSRGK